MIYFPVSDKPLPKGARFRSNVGIAFVKVRRNKYLPVRGRLDVLRKGKRRYLIWVLSSVVQ